MEDYQVFFFGNYIEKQLGVSESSFEVWSLEAFHGGRWLDFNLSFSSAYKK